MDASATSHDVYAQLPGLQDDEIRLVILKSGQRNEPIDCSLVICSMSDVPVYEALSYAWGNRDSFYPITLNGLPFAVFDNLGQGLHRLRDTKLDRAFWIDAICINQADLHERGRQVQKMQQIYQKAKQVVIWLGVEADESDQAVEDIHALHVDEHITEISFYKQFTDNALETADRKFVDRAYPLRCLFERDWFKRIWTVQEVVLAQEALFYCGDRSFSWKCLKEATDAYHAHIRSCCNYVWKTQDRDATYLWYPIAEFVKLVSRLQQSDLQYSFLQVLLLCRHRLASDERDKVYGILGLCNTTAVESIKPDYSLSTREVYLQVARMLMAGSAGLELLTHVFSSHQSPDLPSWVPDWSRADYNNPNSFFSAPNSLGSYNACGPTDREIEIFEDVLSVRAITVDIIDICGPMIRAPNGKGKLRPTIDDTLDKYLQWESLAGLSRTSTSPYFSGPSNVCDAFWRTMIMDVWHDYKDYRHRRASPADYQAFLKWRPWFEEHMQPGADPDASVHSTGIQDPDIYTFHLEILTQNSVRRFFRTRTGYIGMGPMEMQTGDHVMILAGAKEPFVLRPEKVNELNPSPSITFQSPFSESLGYAAVSGNLKDSSEQSQEPVPKANEEPIAHFRLIGFSYLHGIMYGEAAVESEWRKIRIK